MPRLCELQQAFAEAIVEGKYHALTAAMATDRSALRSVALYRRLIRNNFAQVLTITYPVLHRLVGPRYFDVLARGYLKRYPSMSGNLFSYGRHLSVMLFELQVPPLLVELARLEWACHEAYQASDSLPLSEEQLRAIASVDPSQVTFQFHAAARLLSFPFPVYRVWLALQPEAPADEVVELPLPEQETGVVVTRRAGKVQVTHLAREDYLLLEAMSRGVDAASVERMAIESQPEFDFSQILGYCSEPAHTQRCFCERDLMTQASGPLKNAVPAAVSAYRCVLRLLGWLIPLFDLSVRLYLAHIFWKGGMVKLCSWISTVMLFTMVYDVPVLPPELAAYLATAIELGGSFLLAIGLAGRWAALLLFGLNIVASTSYGQLSEAALQEAFYWGILFLYFVPHGPGLLSADGLLRYLYRRKHATSGAENEVSIQAARY
ncbi:MAG: putative DNA-binding domain-containing protein [Nitrospira sp.]|nr:putative DNA-binding domain-containing protein [Nitrospira sp.]